MHIALLTKDTVLANDLRTALRGCGFGTTVIEREADVQTVVRGQDVLILDMMATGEATEAILEKARNTVPGIAVIAVASGDDPAERIRAFRDGVDECVSRSFPHEEVALRAMSLVRRGAHKDHAVLRYWDVTLDRVTRTVTRAGRPIRLTDREYRTLEYFLRNPDRVVSPMELCEQVWKFHFDPRSNVVQVFIMRLRKKIDDGFARKVVHTVPRMGYTLGEKHDEHATGGNIVKVGDLAA